MSNNLEEMMNDIAVIGMAARFPGAKNIDEFWNNLCQGIESIKRSPIKEDDIKDKVIAHGILEDIDLFDANFFGFAPSEAEIMDPQQRLILECAIESLEDAGYTPAHYHGRMGVFIGSGISTYLLYNLLARKDLINKYGIIQISNGNDSISTKVSYKLNLTGPSLDVYTTCSTSLVAVHQACRSLLGYESDMVLAGGVSINVMQDQGYIYQEGGILSPDGYCRPFDAKAKGTVEGSGLGLVVLKRLSDAIEDGDSIHAIIKASAVNNDGSSKVGYTAPSVQGQTNVITEALEIADVIAESITYVETHGTGTVLGDPIEVTALTNAFRHTTTKKEFCAIGSVKSNIGHLNTASGIAGLIKTILALKYKKIPPSLHYHHPNSQIQFSESPFYVNTELKEWNESTLPRRAGVSSFGMGGTNVHVILEESTFTTNQTSLRSSHLIPLSAKSSLSLTHNITNLIHYLEKDNDTELSDIAYTLQVGRNKYKYKNYVTANSKHEAVIKLREISSLSAHVKNHEKKSIVFMFPGQGSQYVNMAREIYFQEPFFKKIVDECCEILFLHLDVDLRVILYPDQNDSEKSTLLQQTAMTQSALFVIEYALAKLWQHKGIQPTAMIGHSLGEYVAACIANVFSLEDALKIVAMRGKLMQSMCEGKMISVNLSSHDILKYLNELYSIAAINTPQSVVISGDNKSIDNLYEKLISENIDVKVLPTSHAYHSKMMDPMLDDFEGYLSKIELSSPSIPYISNLTGKWIMPEEATSVSYWIKHLRQPVQFYEGVTTIIRDIADSIFIEVGPGYTLGGLVKQQVTSPSALIFYSLPHAKQTSSSLIVFLETLGKIWIHGGEIAWKCMYSNEKRRRISLPTYAFERSRYWIDRPIEGKTTLSLAEDIRKPINEWFYIPTWKRLSPLSGGNKINDDDYYIIIDDDNKINTTYVSKGYSIHPSNEYHKINERKYTINFDNIEDFKKILSSIIVDHNKKINIIYLQNNISNFNDLNEKIKIKFHRIFHLIQAIISLKIRNPANILVVTNEAHQVIGNEVLEPEKAMFLGTIKALTQEYNNIKFCNIDVTTYHENLLKYILHEIQNFSDNAVIAYRNDYRWIQSFEPIQLIDKSTSVLRKKGTYIITGGLGNIGLIIAKAIAEKYQANLILIGRSNFPEMTTWDEYLGQNHDNVSVKIRKLKDIKNSASSLTLMQANVAHFEQMKDIFDNIENQYGNIHGIIHAAGNIDSATFQFLDNLTEKDCEKQFQPKANGLHVINKLIEHRKLDFLCLFSSISSLLGGLGHAAYSSANIYMDGYACIPKKTPVISINWDAWYHGEEKEDRFTKIDISKMHDAIKPLEGVEAFLKILNNIELKQLIVSTTDLSSRINRWVRLDKNLVEKIDKVDVTTNYVEPRDAIEFEVAKIWKNILGIQTVGIHDNFFELGGHSLMATQLTSRIRDSFNIEFNLQLLFDHPTIAKVAAVVTEKMLENINDKELEALLSDC